jgi:hypothetical protein
VLAISSKWRIVRVLQSYQHPASADEAISMLVQGANRVA